MKPVRFMNLIKPLTLFLSVVLLFSLFSCGGISGSDEEREKGKGEDRDVEELLKLKEGKENYSKYFHKSEENGEDETKDTEYVCPHNEVATVSTSETHVIICALCRLTMGKPEEHTLSMPMRLSFTINGERVFVYYRSCNVCGRSTDYVISMKNDLSLE